MYLKDKYKNDPSRQISHETIYKILFDFKNIVHTCGEWYKYLKIKNKKSDKRGYLSKTREEKQYFNSLYELSYQERKLRHVWQIDTMYIKGGFILVVVEVSSKKVFAKRIPNLKARTVSEAMQFIFSRVEYVRAIICDRGSENYEYKNWEKFLDTKVYACDPGCPYQKGLVENTIRLLRYWFSRKKEYSSVSDKDVYKASARLNNMYRNSLNKKTANQVYYRKGVQL